MKKVIISATAVILGILLIFTATVFSNPANITTIKLYIISRQCFLEKETFKEYEQSLGMVAEVISGFQDKVPENGRIYFYVGSDALKNKYLSLRLEEEEIKITLTEAQQQAFTDVSDLFSEFGGYIETIYFYPDGTIWFSNFNYREDIVYSPNKRPRKFHSENVSGVPVVYEIGSDWYTVSLTGSFWDLLKVLLTNSFK